MGHSVYHVGSNIYIIGQIHFFSKTLATTDRTEIIFTITLVYWKNGLAVFQLLGKIPASNDLLKIVHKGVQSIPTASFKTLGTQNTRRNTIQPCDFNIDNLRNRVLTSDTEISSNVNSESEGLTNDSGKNSGY